MARHSRIVVAAAAALFAMLGAQPAQAGPATEQLRTQIDQVIKTMEDPSLKAPAKTSERRQALRKLSDGIFDWTEMAKRSLGRHWQARTEAEREEFVKLFADLIEQSYISKIEQYSGEKINYARETATGDQATVRTTMITKQGQEVPVDYRMIRRGDRWLIYDATVEGVSLVNNYRTQFDRIIQTASYQELVSRLKSRQPVKES